MNMQCSEFPLRILLQLSVCRIIAPYAVSNGAKYDAQHKQIVCKRGKGKGEEMKEEDTKEVIPRRISTD
jgi:hypothetical protein